MSFHCIVSYYTRNYMESNEIGPEVISKELKQYPICNKILKI